MNEFRIGDYIKKRREELALSQEELCEGLCSASNLSRVENGQQDPSRRLAQQLLERLGLPEDRFTALWGQRDIAVASLAREIGNGMILFRRALDQDRPAMREALQQQLAELERVADPADRSIRQFVLSQSATLGTPEGPYPLQERLSMLLEALRLTQPRFDLEDFSHGRYSTEESKLINKIANTYTDLGDRKRAIDVYRQLLWCIEKNYKELSGYGGYFCLIAQNYAICLELEKYYQEAIEISEQGRKLSLKSGDYQFLPGFLAVQAECYFFLGNRAKSEELYRMAYYIYKAYEDEANLEIMRQEMKDHLNVEILE